MFGVVYFGGSASAAAKLIELKYDSTRSLPRLFYYTYKFLLIPSVYA